MTLPTPYYADASVTLLLGDCLDLLPLIEAEGLPWFGQDRVDHVITDPPYEAEAHTLQRRVKRDAGAVLTVEPLDFAPMTAADRTALGVRLAPIVKRWSVVFCQVEAAMLWRASGDAPNGQRALFAEGR